LALFLVATAVVLIVGLAVTTISQQVAFADQTFNPNKVTICHVPPGANDPDDLQTITVDADAVAGHIRNHGDIVGPCPGQPEP